MSSSDDESTSSLADQLATACFNGDLPSAKAAVADGASVNEEGDIPGSIVTWRPLLAAVFKKHHDVVVWLLSLGADPNENEVMAYGALGSTAAILSLLIDAGGDVNRDSNGKPSLFWAVDAGSEVKVGCCWLSPALI